MKYLKRVDGAIQATVGIFALVAFLTIAASSSSNGFCSAQEQQTNFNAEQLEFFESKVRPLLANNCFSCHSRSAEKLQAGLLLDSREAVLAGGESGAAIVVGKPRDSLLVQAVRYETYEMPPDRKLANEQIEVLSKWVEMGAPWPLLTEETEVAKQPSSFAALDWEQVRSRHWAWQPIREPPLPEIKDRDWVRNPIDHFTLAVLERSGLSPAPMAEPQILVRRMFLDLIGIPPTVTQLDAFMEQAARDQPAAVERTLDYLLASPLYGQRWGRHWLDVARYSDGYGGFLDKNENTHAWRYRDWVIDAYNSDLPWADFIKLQLAGDLMGTPEDIVATGFFALGPTYISDGGDPDSIAQAKGETLDDRVDTLTRGILGITVSCARCHDHKFDPIPQQDYYSLAGVFNNTSEQERPFADAETVDQFTTLKKELNATEQQLKTAMNLGKKEKRELSQDEQAAIGELQTKRDKLAKHPLLNIDLAHALVETGNRDMKVALRGNLRKEGELAPRRFLRLVSGANPKPFIDGSGRRELAEALVARDNPLTARVYVNRIWQHHFGEAIVRTPSNFGILGQLPTHPELLDWLASQLISRNSNEPDARCLGPAASTKSLHRLIMSSATYQMSSQHDQRSFELDGDNRYFWRVNPRRMDVEALRDSLLAVSGELDTSPGGLPIDDLTSSKRRTVYAKVSRNGDQFASDVFLRTFDFPLMRATVENRPKSTVPQQFLFLLNSAFIVGRATALADQLQKLANSDEERIELAYRMLYSRRPTPLEREIGLGYIAEEPSAETQADRLRSEPQQSSSQLDRGSSPSPDERAVQELPRWVRYAQVLLSSNEFMYVR